MPHFDNGLPYSVYLNGQSSDYAFRMLKSEGMHSPANLNFLRGLRSPGYAAVALCQLQRAGMLSDSNRQALAPIYDHEDITKALGILQQARALYQDNFDVIIQSRYPTLQATLLCQLQQARLLEGVSAQANRNAIRQSLEVYSYSVECLLELLSANVPLTQDHFNLIVELRDIFFGSRATGNIWRSIPAEALTQEHFNVIVRLCQAHIMNHQEAQVALVNYINEHILHIPPHDALATTAQILNDTQSTHTASVHKTTDLSVFLLWSKFGDIEINDDFNQLSLLISQISPDDTLTNDIIQSSLHCLQRLWNTNVVMMLSQEKKIHSLRLMQHLNLHENPEIQPLLETLNVDSEATSERFIPLNTFIHWTYRAIAHQPHALEAFVIALYEIQRGYNFDAQGNDDGKKDAAICYGGTANKFCERCVGLSPFIHFVFVKPETIALKLKSLFFERFVNHYEGMSAQQDKTHLIEQLKQLTDESQVGDAFLVYFESHRTAILDELKNEFDGLCEESDLVRELDSFKQGVIPYLPTVLDNEPAKISYGQSVINRLSTMMHSQGSVTRNSQQHAQPSFFASAGAADNGNDTGTKHSPASPSS